jgi:hypothetical protein
MPRSMRACRTVGNALKAPSSVRWLTFAIIAAHILRTDNVLRNDRTDIAVETADIALMTDEISKFT